LVAACKTTGASTVKDATPDGDTAADSAAPADAGASTDTATAPVKLWPDRFPDALPTELAAAETLHVSPVEFTGPDSAAVIGANGCPFKWVLTADGKFYGLIYLTGDAIKHSIVTRGAPVASAGFAVAQGDSITVDDHSGHYQPDLASLQLAVTALKNLGFSSAEVAPDGVPVPDGCAFTKKN
jgi:hypothetical protein